MSVNHRPIPTFYKLQSMNFNFAGIKALFWISQSLPSSGKMALNVN